MAEEGQMMRKVMAEEQRKAEEVGEIATVEAEGQKMRAVAVAARTAVAGAQKEEVEEAEVRMLRCDERDDDPDAEPEEEEGLRNVREQFRILFVLEL